METKLWNGQNTADLAAAADTLRCGGVVGVPTETVYGLAANALDEDAVRQIFLAKGRPQDNPLIVHISNIESVEKLSSSFTQIGRKLAQAFWPGALTLVLKKSDIVPYIVSAGLETVGIRMPSDPVCRRIIELSGVPIAAPSANSSGKPSPTTAAHVMYDMSGKIDGVVDGGSSKIGVESTVVDVTGKIAVILRPGAVTKEQIGAVIGVENVKNFVETADESFAPPSPGMKYRHYAPKQPLTLYVGAPEDTYTAIMRDVKPGGAVLCFDEYAHCFHTTIPYGKSYDKDEQARRLFSCLRSTENMDADIIFAQCPREFGTGVATVNRLKKSAGGKIINVKTKDIIGVVGVSGSGKTYISRQLAKGHYLINADELYDKMLKEHTDMIREIGSEFPEAMSGGTIDKKVLSAQVFAKPDALCTINKITHKYIVKEILRLCRASSAEKIFIDAPTLFESGLDRYCTEIIGVYAPQETCIARITQRDKISQEQAERRLNNMHNMDFFTAYCDKIIVNE